MITNFRLFESFDKVIQDSYDDYMSLQSDEERKIMARHIRRTAQGFIGNSNSKLSDWLTKFKDEKIVLDVLPKIIISTDDPYGEEMWESVSNDIKIGDRVILKGYSFGTDLDGLIGTIISKRGATIKNKKLFHVALDKYNNGTGYIEIDNIDKVIGHIHVDEDPYGEEIWDI